jgi:hypothetical protein
MRRPSIIVRFVTAATLTIITLAGCATPGPGAGPIGTTGPAPEPVIGTGTGTGSTTGTGTTEPTSAVQSYKVTYDWAVPSTQASVSNPLSVPLPGPIPLPHLAGIYVGDHPEGNPAYERMSFYFRGGLPSYNLQYVPSVLSEGKGEPVNVPGNAVLRVGFINAQAHNGSGSSTITAQPPTLIGFDTLKGYGFAGDFEGHVTYALGIQVAPGSDQAVPIRAGELTKDDGSGGTVYVVHVDVKKA